MGASAEAVDVTGKGAGRMGFKMHKVTTAVERDERLKGVEFVFTFAREEGATYETLVFYKGEIAEAYDMLETYKKTGMLPIRIQHTPGQVNEYIKPVHLIVSQVCYGFRPVPVVVEVDGE